ncbi:MAG: hypothetical protein II474_07285, partial [Firmicutes bacterium]|nr:hypothetical protein [Bacillota bacterium]
MKKSRRRENLKRILALLIVFCMLFGMMDASALRAFAEDLETVPELVEGTEPAGEPLEEPAEPQAPEEAPPASLVRSRGLSALLLQGAAAEDETAAQDSLSEETKLSDEEIEEITEDL